MDLAPRLGARAAVLSSALAVLGLAAPARAGDAEGGVKKIARGRLWKVAVGASHDPRLGVHVESPSTGNYAANAALNARARAQVLEAIGPLVAPWAAVDVKAPHQERCSTPASPRRRAAPLPAGR